MSPEAATEAAAEARPRVLIVDDSRVIRVAAKKILKQEFDVLEAGDGEDAWEQLGKDDQIALVISDLSMPYLDGMGLLKRMREAEKERLRGLPMIIVTGAEDDDGAKSRAFEAGATDFISKPFDSVQLLAHTRSHIRLQKTSEELKETTTVLKEKPATDPFTGLANQRSFLEYGQQSVAYATRHKTELAFVLFQVDGFDQIFVRQGKAVGGAILKAVTAALQAEIRREDVAARISMSRFGLILPSANAVGARKLASRVCERIAGSTLADKDGKPLTITISAGVVTPQAEKPRFDAMMAEVVARLERALEKSNCVVADEAEGETLVPPHSEAAVDEPAAAPAMADNGTSDLSLDSAVAQLARGENAGLTPHLTALARRLLPLLAHWNASQQRGLDEALAKISVELERD